MFDHVCSECGQRELIFASRVRAVVNTDAGIQVTHTCWCGASQTWLTGNAVKERDVAMLAA